MKFLWNNSLWGETIQLFLSVQEQEQSLWQSSSRISSLAHGRQFLMALFSQNLIVWAICSNFCSDAEMSKEWEINSLLRIFFLRGRNPHPCAALISLGRDRGWLWFAWLWCCCSAPLFWLSSGEELRKKILFLTVRVAQISYPGLVLGQFYEVEVWKKKSVFPAGWFLLCQLCWLLPLLSCKW